MARLSKWFPWNRRGDVSGTEDHGIYVVAKFQDTPKGTASITAKEVIFVGGSYGRTSSIKKRLKDFDHSATTGKRRASGGVTFHHEFRGKTKDLYFAYLSVEKVKDASLHPRELVQDGLRKYLLKRNQLPMCNKRRPRMD